MDLVAGTPESEAKDAGRRARRSARPGVLLVVAVACILVTLAVADGAGAFTHVGSLTSTGGQPRPFVPDSFPPQAGCNYTISIQGSVPVARASSGAVTADAAGNDVGALVNSLLAPHETLCFEPGHYAVSTQMQIDGLRGVTLNLDPAAVMQSTSGNRLLLVIASPGTVVRGGQWVGSGRRVSAITLQYGSNDSVVEHTDVSRAGANGILVYDNVRPDYNDSILDNSVHDNGRFGIQEFSNTSAGMTRTVISGNVALDNEAGGIYTNSVSGVTIAENVVRNTVGNGPGEIGIGVTNGYNDTVTLNQVGHMAWFGIQAYYNNDTVISHNVSTFNAGGEDQSGITNDHSSFNTIADNVVDSNGRYGVYLERSWNVTVSGNVADDNQGYGIGLYHGPSPVMGREVISGNTCSFNGLGGMVLNSVVDSLVSMNRCYNNSGDGILLYNDPGQAGSSGNLVSGNLLGNEGGSGQTQTFGIVEANDSGNNTLVSNQFVSNLVAPVSLVGGDSVTAP